MKQAVVYWKTLKAGILSESDEGYSFVYDKDYLSKSETQSISLTMPLREEPFQSNTLHPFFDGLIPEGWLLDIAQKNWAEFKSQMQPSIKLLNRETKFTKDIFFRRLSIQATS